jgi:Tetratricopeptide repeat
MATDPGRDLDDVVVEVGWLLSRASGYLQARGEPRTAQALSRDAYDLYRNALGPDHPETLAAARSLADDLHALGLHDQARKVLSEARLPKR